MKNIKIIFNKNLSAQFLQYFLCFYKKLKNPLHDFCAQFSDKKREKIIAILVLEKYFRLTNQGGILNFSAKKP